MVGGSAHVYAVTFGLLCLVLQVFLPYRTYVRWLKWLTLALLSYVAVVFTVHLDWWKVAGEVFRPRLALSHDMLLMVVAVFGTTISPYLFFWQAAQEVEDTHAGSGQRTRAQDVRRHLRRIKVDTIIGMTFSNLIAFFIILSTAATLHAAGVHGHPDLGPGGGSPASAGRRVHLPAVQPGHHRHRPARGAGAGGIGGLCHGRGVRLGRAA